MMAEDLWMRSTPWDSLYKLECLATKLGARDSTKHSVKLNWMIDYIHDSYRAGFSEKGEFSVRSLSGKGMPSNKGLLDTALFKYELCQHSLDVVLDSIPGSKESKAMIRQHGSDFAKYRASFGYPNDVLVKANPWVSLLEKPVQMYNDFHSQLICSQEFDIALKVGMRAGRSVEEMFEEGSLEQRVTEILEAAKKNAGGADSAINLVTEDRGASLHRPHGRPMSHPFADIPNTRGKRAIPNSTMLVRGSGLERIPCKDPEPGIEIHHLTALPCVSTCGVVSEWEPMVRLTCGRPQSVKGRRQDGGQAVLHRIEHLIFHEDTRYEGGHEDREDDPGGTPIP